ncbi:hypothetical protein ABN028_15975 [Actinopolymorpha sp. B17G11]|uniref:hypothetical protein n=1 Tax=Actinopolymorpha sp. B17G11 TaxID=3160861 RepID=UPI0032E457B3
MTSPLTAGAGRDTTCGCRVGSGKVRAGTGRRRRWSSPAAVRTAAAGNAGAVGAVGAGRQDGDRQYAAIAVAHAGAEGPATSCDCQSGVRLTTWRAGYSTAGTKADAFATGEGS